MPFIPFLSLQNWKHSGLWKKHMARETIKFIPHLKKKLNENDSLGIKSQNITGVSLFRLYSKSQWVSLCLYCFHPDCNLMISIDKEQ